MRPSANPIPRPRLRPAHLWPLALLLAPGCGAPSDAQPADTIALADGDASARTTDSLWLDVDPTVDAELDTVPASDLQSAVADSADGGVTAVDTEATEDASSEDADGAAPDAEDDAPSDAHAEPEPDIAPDVAPPLDTQGPDSGPPIVDVPMDDSEADAPDLLADTGPLEPPDIAEDTADEGPVPSYEGTCCAPNGSPGCDNPDCVVPMCEMDAYCCTTTWDTLCAKCAAGQSVAGTCDGMAAVCGCDASGAGPCCEAHSGVLCDTVLCNIAVCELDPYCCETSWDSYCADCAQGGLTYGDVPCPDVDEDCGCEPATTGPTHFELAEAWAPVWYHDTDDSAYEADYITAYDFDGDTVSANNWDNLYAPSSDLRAVIYWSIVETTTHWYILYTDFHPRDWTEDCDPFLPFSEPCHENDMEGAMVMVEKDGSEWGAFVLLITEAHNVLHLFRNDPAITALSTESLEDVPVTFEGVRHPELYVESKGHGVCALQYDGDKHCEHPVGVDVNPFPGGDGIVYRYKGVAEEPTSGNDQDVGYALVSFYDTLWQRRDDICNGSCTFDQTFEYDGVSLAKAFDGDSWGDDKANPPWAWDDPDDGPVYRGDFFFRPAHAVATWVDLPSALSQTYLFNPYLDEL